MHCPNRLGREFTQARIIGENGSNIANFSGTIDYDLGGDCSLEGTVLKWRPGRRRHWLQILAQGHLIDNERLQWMRIAAACVRLKETGRHITQVLQCTDRSRHFGRTSAYRSCDHAAVKGLVFVKRSTPSKATSVCQQHCLLVHVYAV